MQITSKRQLNERLLGFFLLSHPGPVLVHILAVTVFTLLAACATSMTFKPITFYRIVRTFQRNGKHCFEVVVLK